MMFNHLSTARLYLGSDQGLMYVDVSVSPPLSLVSNSSTPCNVSLCGKVLTISNDGKLVVVSDTVSTPSQVYIYNAGNTQRPRLTSSSPAKLVTAAAFSPDQLKLFILTNTGNMYVYSTVDALTSVPIATSATRHQILGGWQLRLRRGNTRANFDFRLFYLQSPTYPPCRHRLGLRDHPRHPVSQIFPSPDASACANRGRSAEHSTSSRPTDTPNPLGSISSSCN